MLASRLPSLLLCSIGIYLFASGFFLTKLELPHTASCDATLPLLTNTIFTSAPTPTAYTDFLIAKSLLTATCTTPPLAKSLTIIVIDALRFDFALNALPFTFATFPPNTPSTRLSKFIADPPTVTTQRLKGLTTGGLPTFADVSTTFTTAEITEDTWLSQLAHSDPNPPPHTAFAGDDTWSNLFPSPLHFTGLRAPFPSFNTRDINTVDDGIIKHLPFLLGPANTATVTIMHFLGVDHVGHTFGSECPMMTEKLKQMDGIVRNILTVRPAKSIGRLSDAPLSSQQRAMNQRLTGRFEPVGEQTRRERLTTRKKRPKRATSGAFC